MDKGTVYRQKGSRYWWISYITDGKRRRESSKSESLDYARALLAQRRTLKDSAGNLTPSIQDLVSDLLDWYLTENPRASFHANTLSRWRKHLKPFFADMRAEELGSAQLRAYRSKRTKEGAAFATINRELQILRKAFKLAIDSDPPRIERMPSFKNAIGREKNARRVFIEPALARKLKEVAGCEVGLWARAYLEIAFTLGWRRGEIRDLKVGNVHLAENTLRIEDSKNEEPREVALTESLRILLEPLVIGRRPHESLWPVRQFRKPWKRICAAAGIQAGKLGGFILHDVRRTSARSKRAAGVSESVIMDIHGWKSAAMFRRYGIVNQADRADALAKEERMLAGCLEGSYASGRDDK